jgi:hypothetical protein
MTGRRKILLACAAFVAAIVAFLAVTGGANFIFLLITLFIQGALFPSTISWDSHAAATKCPGAIAHTEQWPPGPAAACEAMWMCANEAALTDSERKALYAQIRNTPGCQEP